MKSKVLFSILGMAAMLFVGCSTDEPTPPQIDKPVNLTLTLTEGAITATTYKVNVKASDQEVSYLCLCLPVAAAADLADKDLIATIMADVIKQAASKGQEPAAFIASISKKGNQTLIISDLSPGTEYTVVAFGVSGIAAAENVARLNFATNRADKIDCSFEIVVDAASTTAAFKITPSVKDVKWYFCTMTQETYDRVQKETGYDMANMYFSYFGAEAETLLSSGMTPEEVLEQQLHTGNLELKAADLTAETKYIYMAGAIQQVGDNLVLISDISSGNYTTDKATPSNMTFILSATEIGKNKANIAITPSNNEEKYLYACRPLDENSLKLSAEQLMKDVIKGYPGPTINFALVSGVKAFPEFHVIAGVRYYLLAFGYSGGPTTEPELKYFETIPGGDPSETTFDIKINAGSVMPNSATLSFTPSDETVYYAFALMDRSDVDNVVMTNEIEDGLKQYRDQQKMFDPNVTMSDILDMQYFCGDTPNFKFDELTPSTTYLCSVITFNLDGTVAKIDTRKNFLTTPAPANVSVDSEVLGYFDGNDEGGKLFGKPEVTKDKALVVLKYNPSAGAKNILTYTQEYITQEDEYGNVIYDPMMPEFESDASLFSSISNWQDVSIASPYLFVVVDWVSENINFSYATDANDIYGPIKRTFIAQADKANVGTFEELKALYDQVAPDKTQNVSANRMVYKRAAATSSLGSRVINKNRDFSTIVFNHLSSAAREMNKVSMPTLKPACTYRLGADYYMPLARSFKHQ